MSRAHPERRGAGIHPVDKGGHAAEVPAGQHVREVAGRRQQKPLQQLILGETLTGNHWQHRLTLVLLGDVGRDVRARHHDYRAWIIEREGMILYHDQGRHHLRRAGHRQRRAPARASYQAEAIDDQRRRPLRRPWQRGGRANALRDRDDGRRGGHRKGAKVLKSGDRQQQRQQKGKRTPEQGANASRGQGRASAPRV